MDCPQELPLPSFPFLLPSSNDSSSIPLNCNICTKKPTFSDISHLLTHIASKGHLSTYYKIKIKAATEDDARNLIDDYDNWYASWSIESLMSERMNTKEARRKQKARSSGACLFTKGTYPKLTTPSLAAPTSKRQPLPQSTRDTFVFEDGPDPFLDSSTIKHEVDGYTIVPTPNDAGHSLSTPPWLSTGYHYEDHLPMQGAENEENTLLLPSMYSPTPSRFSHFNTSTDSALFDMRDSADVEPEGRNNEPSRLKGVLWPGMDMFDAATPDMRRKRNQKKSTDVITRLEAVSRDIEATEVVYSAEGIVQKERPITGYPHPDSSPLKGEPTPPPKKKRLAPRRKPLAPKDPNARPKATAQKSGRRRADPKQGSSVTETKPGTKAKPLAKQTSASPLMTTDHPLTYLTSAFEYRPSSEEEAPVIQFRPAMDWSVYNHLRLSASPAYSSTLSNESTMLPAWDFMGHDVGSSLLNPLFIDTEQAETGAGNEAESP